MCQITSAGWGSGRVRQQVQLMPKKKWCKKITGVCPCFHTATQVERKPSFFWRISALQTGQAWSILRPQSLAQADVAAGLPAPAPAGSPCRRRTCRRRRAHAHPAQLALQPLLVRPRGLGALEEEERRQGRGREQQQLQEAPEEDPRRMEVCTFSLLFFPPPQSVTRVCLSRAERLRGGHYSSLR